MSTTYNKNLNSLLNFLIHCIHATSAPQILSIKECTFLFSNFLIINLCNSFAIHLLEVISFLTFPPEVDLSTSKAVFLSKKIINY